MIERLRHLFLSLLEEIYCKTVIPQISYCILVWGNCSDALFTQLKNQHIRAARVIYKVTEKVCVRTVKWQNLGYIYKRRVGSKMFKIVEDSSNHGLSSHFKIMHQSIPSRNIPPQANLRALFSHGQIPAPRWEDFAKIRPPLAKDLDKKPTPREIFFTFFNTVMVILT